MSDTKITETKIMELSNEMMMSELRRRRRKTRKREEEDLERSRRRKILVKIISRTVTKI